jgi:predicted PurR-regulated permease PerM
MSENRAPTTTPPLPAPTTTPPLPAPGRNRERVPVRTILTTIGLVLATALGLLIVVQVQRVLVWMVIAVFFAVALHPVVNWVERRVTRGRRALATLLVFVVVLLALIGLAALFIVPLAKEGTDLARQLPGFVEDVRAGRGVVGRFLDRTNGLDYLQRNESRIREFVGGLGTPALSFLRGAATGVAAALTIFVLSYLMVLEAPLIIDGTLGLFPADRADRIRRVGTDCARTVTGYLSGNLLISVICGLLSYVVLLIAGVPFAALIALFVAIADLIPLVGATLGAVVATLAALVQSVPAGIGVLVFFIVYQQLENHLLQPLILSRAVRLNPLTVLVSILIGVELAGILGALLAIPVAGVLQIVVRDVWQHRRPVEPA